MQLEQKWLTGLKNPKARSSARLPEVDFLRPEGGEIVVPVVVSYADVESHAPGLLRQTKVEHGERRTEHEKRTSILVDSCVSCVPIVRSIIPDDCVRCKQKRGEGKGKIENSRC